MPVADQPRVGWCKRPVFQKKVKKKDLSNRPFKKDIEGHGLIQESGVEDMIKNSTMRNLLICEQNTSIAVHKLKSALKRHKTFFSEGTNKRDETRHITRHVVRWGISFSHYLHYFFNDSPATSHFYLNKELTFGSFFTVRISFSASRLGLFLF